MELVLVGAVRWATGEVICYVREMQEEGDGIDEEDRADFGGRGNVTQEVCGDDAAVGVGDEDAFGPVVGVEDGEDVCAHFVLRDGGVSDAKAYGHDFDGDDADLAVLFRGGGMVEFGEKVYVRVEAYANAVDKEDGKSVGGSVGAVPVG